MTFCFDVVNSPSLSEEEKDLVMRRLASRIGKTSRCRPNAVGLPRSAK